ncbi:MAG: shikimate kinase [Cytophagaceae bacterium]|nr:shikimate kinase [Cytophagaceae bacterium]
MIIFLIGLPGSGKTTLGKELCKTLHLKFIDTDDEICKKENSTIEKIFETKGENFFRSLEKETLAEVSSHSNVVISTGGGLPCFFDNMEKINEAGISIFINVSPEIITERLFAAEDQNRPMLKGKNKEQLLQFLKDKLKERLPFYSKAKVEFKNDKLTADDIISELKKRSLVKS